MLRSPEPCSPASSACFHPHSTARDLAAGIKRCQAEAIAALLAGVRDELRADLAALESRVDAKLAALEARLTWRLVSIVAAMKLIPGLD